MAMTSLDVQHVQYSAAFFHPRATRIFCSRILLQCQRVVSLENDMSAMLPLPVLITADITSVSPLWLIWCLSATIPTVSFQCLASTFKLMVPRFSFCCFCHLDDVGKYISLSFSDSLKLLFSLFLSKCVAKLDDFEAKFIFLCSSLQILSCFCKLLFSFFFFSQGFLSSDYTPPSLLVFIISKNFLSSSFNLSSQFGWGAQNVLFISSKKGFSFVQLQLRCF